MQMKDLVSKLRYFAIALSVIMVISACGSDDESSDQDNGAPVVIETRNEIFTPVPKLGNNADAQIEEAVIKDEESAIRHMWVYLNECVDLDKTHIKVDRGIGTEWMIRPTELASQEFGTWRIINSGEILPHNSKAELWKKYLGSGCDTNVLKPAATDVLTDTDASILLWTQLAKCNPELMVNAFSAQKNRKTGSWVIVTNTDAREDFGVWSVERNANITPLNERSKEVWDMLKLIEKDDSDDSHSEAKAQCSPVIRSDDDARRRLWTNLSPCFPSMDIEKIRTSWDPANHVWVLVSSERAASSSSDVTTSVWHILKNGDINPKNLSAEASLAITQSKNC